MLGTSIYVGSQFHICMGYLSGDFVLGNIVNVGLQLLHILHIYVLVTSIYVGCNLLVTMSIYVGLPYMLGKITTYIPNIYMGLYICWVYMLGNLGFCRCNEN